MEPDGSLLCSQEPDTSLYPETDASVHIFPSYFPNIHSNIILPSVSRSCEWCHPFRFSNQNTSDNL